MDFKQYIRRSKESVNASVGVRAFTPNESFSSANLPVYPIWYYSPIRGIPRAGNVSEMREFAKSAWVQMVTNAIKRAIIQTDWDIVVDDHEGEEVNEEQFKDDIKYVRTFLEHPNRDHNSTFADVISPFLNDVLEIDAGVLFLNGKKDQPLLEIIPYDGSTFLKEQDINGFMKTYWQFSYQHPITDPKPFDPLNIGYLQLNRRSYSPYGYSPLEAIQQVVEVLDQATRYNKEFFLHDAIPALIMNIATSDETAAEKFKNEWLEKHEGRNSRFGVINAPEVGIHQLNPTNRDMEWLDGQKWYMHLVFAVYGISPTEVGFTDSTNGKNVQEGQIKITVRNAHLPYLSAIERLFNRQIIPWILGELSTPVHKRKPLKFKYLPRDYEMERAEADGQRADVAASILTVNEVRKARGLPPIKHEGADNPFHAKDQDAQLQREAFSNKGDDDGKGTSSGKKGEDEKDARDRERGERSKSFDNDLAVIVKSFSEEHDDSVQDYGEFFDALTAKWLSAVERGVKKALVKDYKPEIQKDLGSFLQHLGSVMTALPLLRMLRNSVKRTMERGVEEAEKDLDMNVVLGVDFDRRVERNFHMQVEGYQLKNGKRWHGIKGFSNELQSKLLVVVQEGIQKGKAQDEVIGDVREVFKNLGENRARVIVRTESDRMINEAKLSAFQESGVSGKKQWVAFPNAEQPEVCPTGICAELDGQTVGFDEMFTAQGQSFSHGPAHPQCKCFIRFTR